MSKIEFASSSKESKNEENGNGLLLYQYYSSFYSQKVVFALIEKKLEFKSHFVDLGKAEQYQPWYLKINPRAEVPVLKDGIKIIPDSTRIIDYLEDNFSNGKTPHLLPDKGTDELIKVKKFDELLSAVSPSELTFGSMFFPELCTNSKVTAFERQTRKHMLPIIDEKLTEMVLKYPEFKEHFQEKQLRLKELTLKLQNIEKFRPALDNLEQVLDLCEEEMASRSKDKSNWWLCCESFSIADITLAVLLTRLQHVGLYERYFKNPLRPCLKTYFERIQQRDSYKEIIAQSCENSVAGSYNCQKIQALVVGSMVVLGVVVAAIFIYKRAK